MLLYSDTASAVVTLGHENKQKQPWLHKQMLLYMVLLRQQCSEAKSGSSFRSAVPGEPTSSQTPAVRTLVIVTTATIEQPKERPKPTASSEKCLQKQLVS